MQANKFFVIALLFLKINAFAGGGLNPNTARISVYVEGAKSTDSVTLIFWNKTLGSSLNTPANDYIPKFTQRVGMNPEGWFVFETTSIDEIGYFSMYREHVPGAADHRYMLEEFLVEPSDDIKIKFLKDKNYRKELDVLTAWNYLYWYQDAFIEFSGKGSSKCSCKYAGDCYYRTISREFKRTKRDGQRFRIPDGKYNENNPGAIGLRGALHIVDSMKNKLSPLAYQLEKIDYLANDRTVIFADIYTDLRITLDGAHTTISLAPFIYATGEVNEFRGHFYKEDPFKPFSEKARLLSNWYGEYVGRKALCARQIIDDNDSVGNEIYSLEKQYQGEMRDRVLTLFLVDYFRAMKDADNILNHALNTVKTPFYLRRLQELSDAQAIGRPAYNFEMPDTAGKLVRLSDFKGKVVFVDFWYTGCVHCADLYNALISKAEERFRGNPEVVFVTISVDMEREEWMKSLYGTGKTKSRYTSLTDAVNLYTGGVGIGHPMIDYYHIDGYPHPMLIDRDGKIFKTENSLYGYPEHLISLINEALTKK